MGLKRQMEQDVSAASLGLPGLTGGIGSAGEKGKRQIEIKMQQSVADGFAVPHIVNHDCKPRFIPANGSVGGWRRRFCGFGRQGRDGGRPPGRVRLPLLWTGPVGRPQKDKIEGRGQTGDKQQNKTGRDQQPSKPLVWGPGLFLRTSHAVRSD